MLHDDIFCGECGSVSRSVTEAFTGTILTGVTAPITSLRGIEDGAEPARHLPEPPPRPAPSVVSGPPAWSEAETATAPEWLREPHPGPEALHGNRHAHAASFLDDSVTSDEAAAFDAAEDVAATRLVSRKAGERFVLQFSTGESVAVHGTGLIGRNPQPEPGEFFDQLVRVLDTGKSVSKTHLEFGQEGGAFWIKDRFSGNGTLVREPDVAVRRCEAGRRYRVTRGTRVDIGEQFFIVS